jgi:prolyl oligopeptidase
VYDVESHRFADAIPHARYAQPRWLPDSGGFFYWWRPSQPDTDGVNRPSTLSWSRLHLLGRPIQEDVTVWGSGAAPGVSFEENELAFVTTHSGAPEIAIGTVKRGSSPEIGLYVTSVENVGSERRQWKKLAGYEREVLEYDVDDGCVYVLTVALQKNGEIECLPLQQPRERIRHIVVKAGRDPITDFSVASDGIYVLTLHEGKQRPHRLDRSTGAYAEVPLPDGESVRWLSTDPELPGAVLWVSAWDQPPRAVRFDPLRNALVGIGQALRPTSRLPGIAVKTGEAVSEDGTRVPVTVLHRSDMLPSTRTPAVLWGYGAYGTSITPAYWPDLLAWVERGGVFALAHVRGGGERGARWHEAARRSRKPRAVEDFIACAEWLISQGYSSPERLGAVGKSAGGITVGAASIRRPDLFRAVVLQTPVVNPLRSEFAPGGSSKIFEYGSVEVAEEFASLRRIDPYHLVRNGREYPAMMLTTARNDVRVPTWQAAKLAARLQDRAKTKGPVLLRVNLAGGHGVTATRTEQHREWSETLGFLWSELTR